MHRRSIRNRKKTGILVALFAILVAIFSGVKIYQTNAIFDESRFSKTSWTVNSETARIIASAPKGTFKQKVSMHVARIESSFAKNLSMMTDRSTADIYVLDISFWDKDDEEVEPLNDVNISIELKKDVASSTYDIIHLNENGHIEKIDASVSVESNKLSFATESFSIFAIVPTTNTDEQKYARYTYEYYVDDEKVGSQVVKNGDFLYAPAVPTKNGEYFSGWVDDGGRVFSGHNKIVAIPTSETEDKTIRLDALFSEPTYSVIFHDDEGNITSTKKGLEGAVITVNDVYFEVTAGRYISAWTTVKDEAGYTDEEIIAGDVGQSVTLGTTDIKLYPIIRGVKWVFFNANDEDDDYQSVASLTPSTYVKSGERVTQPSNPIRAGYTFAGWYTSATGGNRFNFNNRITADTELYAHWTANTNTPYRVIYWYEVLDDEGTYEEGRYAVADYSDLTGRSGSTITVSQTTINNLLRQDKYKYYEYDKTDTGVIIHGDGSSIVNVYLKMKVYTVNFVIDTLYNRRYRFTYLNSSGSNAYVQSSSNNTHVAPSLIDGYFVDGNGNQYAFADGYSFQARMGQDISSMWPSIPDVIFTKDNGLTGLRSYAWVAQDNNPTSSNFVSKNIELTTSHILTDGSAGATFYLKGTVQSNSGTTQANYWLKNPNTGNYEISAKHSFVLNNQTSNLTGKTLNGYNLLSQTPSGYEGHASDYSVYNFYYDPIEYTLYFYNYNTMDQQITDVAYHKDLAGYYYEPTRPSEIIDTMVFTGWFTTPECITGTEFDFDNGMPRQNLILYAKWEQKTKVTITFDSNGGTEVPSQTINYGTTGRQPAKPTREGYVFGGWIKEDGTYFHFGSQLTEDIRLVARWLTGESYTISYSTDAGTMTETDDNHYTDAATTVTLGMPSNIPEGKVFAGWLLDGEVYYPGSTLVVKSSDADEQNNITLVAIWEESPEPTQVVFKANGGTGDDIVINLEQNDAVTMPTEAESGFSKTGYHLLNWNSKADGSGVTFEIGTQWGVDNYNGTRAVLTNGVYAQWEINTYTLTVHHLYEDNSQFDSDVTATYDHGQTYTASPSNLNSDKYDNYLKEGDSATGEMTSDLEVTYYYKKKTGTVTVHHIDNNGDTLEEDTVTTYEYDEEWDANPSATLTPNYYYTTADSVSGTMSGNVEVTYVYTRKTATLTVRHQDSEGNELATTETSTVLYGDTYTTHPSPDLTTAYNYTASGPESDTVSGDITITYTYTKKTYTLTVHHVKEDGSEYKPDVTTTYEHGDTYTAVPNTEDNNYEYRLKDGDSASDTITSNVEVTYIYKKKTATLTIIHQYADGSEAAPTETITIEWGETYTAHPSSDLTTAYNYTVTGSETGPVSGDVTVTYTYTKKQYTLTVHHVKEDGSEYKPDVTTTYEHGDTYTAVPNTEDNNYEYRLKDGDSASDTITSDLEVTYIYKKKTATLTVIHQYSDGSEAAPTETSTVEWGDTYTTHPSSNLTTAHNYTVTGSETDVVAGDVTVTYTYTKKTYTLTVHHRLENGSQYKPDVTTTYEYGDTYTAVPNTEDNNYEYRLRDGDSASDTITSNVEVTYIYKKKTATLTVIHQYSDGSEAAPTETSTVEWGETYTTHPSSNLTTAYNYTVTGSETNVVAGDVTVTYTYTKKTYTVTVHHVKADGSAFAADDTATVEHGDPYTAVAKEDPNYNPVVIEGALENPSITSDTVITIQYVIKTATITVIHQYADGSEAAPTETINKDYGDTYSVTPKESLLEAYNVSADVSESGTVSGDITITYTYTKKTYTLTVHHVKEDGSEYKPDVTTTYEHGDTYTAVPNTEDNNYEYRLKDGDSASDTITSNMEVTYIYKKKTATFTVKHHDVNGGELADDEVTTLEWGDTYTAHPNTNLLTAYNYDTQDAETGPVSGNITVTYIYTKKTFIVTIHHIDEDGNQLVDDEEVTVEYGDDYDVRALDSLIGEYDYHIDGEAHIPSITSDCEATVIYTKKAEVPKTYDSIAKIIATALITLIGANAIIYSNRKRRA